MGVTRDDVRGIAKLAKLDPADDEVERLTEELNGILDHVRMLEELDISSVDEDARVTGSALPFRDPQLPPDALAEGAAGRFAPDWKDGFFVVPRLPALGADDSEGGSA